MPGQINRGSYDSIPWPHTSAYSGGIGNNYINDNDKYSAKYLPRLEAEKANYFRGSNEEAMLRNPQGAKYWNDIDNLTYKTPCKTLSSCSYVVGVLFILFVLVMIFMK